MQEKENRIKRLIEDICKEREDKRINR